METRKQWPISVKSRSTRALKLSLTVVSYYGWRGWGRDSSIDLVFLWESPLPFLIPQRLPTQALRWIPFRKEMELFLGFQSELVSQHPLLNLRGIRFAPRLFPVTNLRKGDKSSYLVLLWSNTHVNTVKALATLGKQKKIVLVAEFDPTVSGH